MSVESLGTFAEGFASWRRVLASCPPAARLTVFENAAHDVAQYIRKGLDKVAASDELYDIATAHNVAEGDADVVQGVITRAFYDIEVELNHPPEEPEIEDRNGNGKGNGKSAHGLRFLTKADFIGGFIPPNYLIDGMLQRRFVYALTGQTGHAKTAIALLIAGLVSTAEPNAMLGSHKVEKGQVVYFVGENPDDIRMRVIGADSMRNDDPLADRITFIPGQFNIGQMQGAIAAYTQGLGGSDLVVIDTSAAYFLGNEELNNTQMGAHARMLRKLTELPGGPCVLVLCHPIKHVSEPSQLLPRGGGAFLAEMDGNLTAWKQDDMIELHHNKIRGPGFEAMSFKLERITTSNLVDSKGRMLPTVRAVAISRSEESTQEKKTRDDEDRVLAALLSNPDASMADIAEGCGWTFASGEPAKSRVRRAINRIDTSAKPKLLRKNREKWELTEEGKTAARRAALDFEQQGVNRAQMGMDL